MKAGEDRFGFIAGGTWCADHNKLLDRWPGEELGRGQGGRSWQTEAHGLR